MDWQLVGTQQVVWQLGEQPEEQLVWHMVGAEGGAGECVVWGVGCLCLLLFSGSLYTGSGLGHCGSCLRTSSWQAPHFPAWPQDVLSLAALTNKSGFRRAPAANRKIWCDSIVLVGSSGPAVPTVAEHGTAFVLFQPP